MRMLCKICPLMNDFTFGCSEVHITNCLHVQLAKHVTLLLLRDLISSLLTTPLFHVTWVCPAHRLSVHFTSDKTRKRNRNKDPPIPLAFLKHKAESHFLDFNFVCLVEITEIRRGPLAHLSTPAAYRLMSSWVTSSSVSLFLKEMGSISRAVPVGTLSKLQHEISSSCCISEQPPHPAPYPLTA